MLSYAPKQPDLRVAVASIPPAVALEKLNEPLQGVINDTPARIELRHEGI